MSNESPVQTGITCAVSIVGVVLVGPLWYYLLYKILQMIGATESMWLAYWLYLPAAVLVGIAGAFVKWLAGR